MSVLLRIVLLCGIAVYFCLVIHFLKTKSLVLKYSLLWFLFGIMLAVITLFPQILEKGVRIFGIEAPINGLFVVCIFFVLMILMSITAICSKHSEKITTLIQKNALLEERVRELEEQSQDKRNIV